MRVSIHGPIEEVTMALCGRPARDHWQPSPDGFDRKPCEECAALGRVVSARRRAPAQPEAIASQEPAKTLPPGTPYSGSDGFPARPMPGQPIRQQVKR